MAGRGGGAWGAAGALGRSAAAPAGGWDGRAAGNGAAGAGDAGAGLVLGARVRAQAAASVRTLSAQRAAIRGIASSYGTRASEGSDVMQRT